MKDYKQQYLDPRWQKKRLEVLKQANWKCEKCKSEKKTLHVHHKKYFKDRDVWDYANKYLICLCEDCHEETTEKQKMLKYINETILIEEKQINNPKSKWQKEKFLWNFHVSLLWETPKEFDIGKLAILGQKTILKYLNLEIRLKRNKK